MFTRRLSFWFYVALGMILGASLLVPSKWLYYDFLQCAEF